MTGVTEALAVTKAGKATQATATTEAVIRLDRRPGRGVRTATTRLLASSSAKSSTASSICRTSSRSTFSIGHSCNCYLTEDVVCGLMKLRARCHEDFLSGEQRSELFHWRIWRGGGSRLMNATDAARPAGSLAGLRGQLLAAAAAFAERVYDTSEELLRATVRIQHVYLKNYPDKVTGTSLKWSRNKVLLAIIECATEYCAIRRSRPVYQKPAMRL